MQDLPETPDIKVVIRTDLGNVRTNNEDAGLYLRVSDAKVFSEKGCILLVADGMGGHAAGEVASKMATDIISKEYFSNSSNDITKALSKAFALANKSILNAAARDSEKKGMGTTCTVLVVAGSTVYYAHVGDSRAYALRNKKIERITTDHTYVQQLIKDGSISREEAEKHPQRNILTNAMGTKPEMPVDTGQCAFVLQAHDRLMLCSDGLYDYLMDEEIEAMLNQYELQEAATQLIAEAKKRGGHDNITVVLAEKLPVTAAKPAKQTRDVALPVTKEIDLP